MGEFESGICRHSLSSVFHIIDAAAGMFIPHPKMLIIVPLN
jgi:hypothetical protein